MSKAWNRTLQAPGCETLWRYLIFSKSSQRLPRKKSVLRLLARSGYDLRQLIISNPHELEFLLQSCKRLHHLELGPTTNKNLIPDRVGLCPELRRLLLHGYCLDSAQNRGTPPSMAYYPPLFMESISQNLEQLELINAPHAWRKAESIPHFPRLRLLRLKNFDNPRWKYSIVRLAAHLYVCMQPSPLAAGKLAIFR